MTWVRKLTDQDEADIRSRFNAGTPGHVLADLYDVCISTIYRLTGPSRERRARPLRRNSHLEPTTPVGWKQDAACLGLDPDLFHPTRDDNVAASRAKAICADCAVREPCLTVALAVPRSDDYGIYGGTTPTERRGIRQRQAQAATA